MQGCELNIVNVPLGFKSRKNEARHIKSDNKLKAGINIYVGTPISILAAIKKLKDYKVLTNYNIGIWFWELDKIPRLWVNIGKVVDEIWCQSSYIQQSFSEQGENKNIKIMPFSLDISFTNNKTRNDAFTYITTFDFLSHASRKNPIATLKSYIKSWKEEDGCKLIIKTVNGSYNKTVYSEMLELINRRIDIKIIDEYYSSEDLRKLIGKCDAYISLHRAEGLGMGMAEAMKLGVPVIATGYSGNMQYMDKNSSYLVDYKLIKAINYPDAEGCQWAEPDLTHAASIIRSIRNNEIEREEKIKKAKICIEKYNKENQRKWIIENI